MNIKSSRTLLLVAAIAVLLAGCDQSNQDRTAGQKLDAAVAQTGQKSEEFKTDIKNSTANAVNAVADKTRDAAITAAVNAELMRDSKLSALKIDVDTTDGRVVLRGTAPDTASVERAKVLAGAVSGVVSVENALTVARN